MLSGDFLSSSFSSLFGFNPSAPTKSLAHSLTPRKMCSEVDLGQTKKKECSQKVYKYHWTGFTWIDGEKENAFFFF